MDDLLTTKQLQEMLQVDRITIYRMLNDGRLRGFKVGGQWRFSRSEIEAWLHQQQSSLDSTDMPPPPGGSITPTLQALPLSCVEAIQGVCAEALDIAAVTIDLDGTPLTGISNSCEFCNLILSTAEGRRRCAEAWKRLDGSQVHACHAGLLCISTPIEIGGQRLAITAACQFSTRSPGAVGSAQQFALSTLAADLGLTTSDLQAAAGGVRIVPESHLSRIVRLVLRVADTFSEIGQERLNLLSRLQHIAEMSKL